MRIASLDCAVRHFYPYCRSTPPSIVPVFRNSGSRSDQRPLYEPILARPKRAFTGLRVGSPLPADALVGPLIDAHARGHQIGSWELQKRICTNAGAFPVPRREPRHIV
jgi:hypothetical protein